MISARVRLALLWVSQVARVVADWGLRLTTVLVLLATGVDSAWYLATAAFVAPFVLLAPLNGCLSNGLPRRAVLAGSSLFTLAAVAGFAAADGPWLGCLAVVALGAAVYSPTRYAVLPAAAVDTRLPLPRVNSLIEMGGAAAIVFGLWLGFALAPRDGTHPALAFGVPAVSAVLGLNLLCLTMALPVRFPSDVSRPESPARAVAGFFRDCGRVFRTPEARVPVLGLAAFQALVTAGAWPLLGLKLTAGPEGFADLLWVLMYVGGGAALGCLAASIQSHPRRCVGLVPFGATGLVLVLLWLMATADPSSRMLPVASCVLLGFTGGLINVPLRASYMAAVPTDARGNGMAVMNFTLYVGMTLLSLLMTGLIDLGVLVGSTAQLAFLAVLAALGAAAAWWLYLPPAFESLLEAIIWPMYRVRVRGPGAGHIPTTGPLLVLANHSAYLDPFWVMKSLPRRARPMMTSVFYDIPGITWWVRGIIKAIRVPAATFRREAPELNEAVAELRRGGCVLVFPEAMLRRTAEQPLRRFGQGVWRILQEVPETTVLVAWIEGGWGSWTSYVNGPPFKNKRPDWRRPIDIAFEEPHALSPEVRADQHATRAYLMRTCLECRRYLGLEVPVVRDALLAKEAGEEGNPIPAEAATGAATGDVPHHSDAKADGVR